MDPVVALGCLWAHRTLVETSLGCTVTIQRLCVLLLAVSRPHIEPWDIQDHVDEFEGTPHHERLCKLGCPRRAYGQLYRLHRLGLMMRSGPGLFALSARARSRLERMVALRHRCAREPVAFEELDITYSVHVQEIPGS